MFSVKTIRALLTYREISLLDLILSGKSIKESFEIESDIDEARIHLSGEHWSKKGNCVVLAGGPGSGKGFIKKNLIAADFYSADTDELKKLYNSLIKRGKIQDPHGLYDLTNSDHVSKLHSLIKDKKWDKMQQNMLVHIKDGSNIVFDITGKESSKLKYFGECGKNLGYTVTLIWVATNRQLAWLMNLDRERKVGKDLFNSIHDQVNTTLLDFLKGAAVDYDDAYIVFNGGQFKSSASSEIAELLNKYDIVKLEKQGSSFVVPAEFEKDLLRYLGTEHDIVDPL